jgi:hypothetical protein
MIQYILYIIQYVPGTDPVQYPVQYRVPGYRVPCGGGFLPPLHPTDQSGSSLRVHTEEA